jgi:hypothetical protein
MSGSTERIARAVVLALSLAGSASCGNHQLSLSMALASDSCTVPVPAGGSILYQVTAADTPGDGGTISTFCGGCLAVPGMLADSNAILDFLRANAPTCSGVKANTSLRVALTAWSVPGCPDGAPTQRVFCSQSPPVTLPDGHSDAVVSVVITCDPTCGGSTGVIQCTPTTCMAIGKNCGAVSDGCGGTLQCGTCQPPQQCGGKMGNGVPNVCSH